MSTIVYNMDCIDYMKTLPDNAFDLAVVDPPYGVGSITYMPCKRTNAAGGYFDRYDILVATLSMEQRAKLKVNVEHDQCGKDTVHGFGDDNVSPPPEYFKELFRVSRNQIIWGGNYFLLPPSRGFIVWDKQQSEKFSMAMAELAWTSFNANAKIFRKQASVNSASNDPRIHPTQKPVALYEWILTNYAHKGERILDTHVGSGSSRIAAAELGFDYVGCELDKDYFEAEEARFARWAAQGRLFEETREKQGELIGA